MSEYITNDEDNRMLEEMEVDEPEHTPYSLETCYKVSPELGVHGNCSVDERLPLNTDGRERQPIKHTTVKEKQ